MTAAVSGEPGPPTHTLQQNPNRKSCKWYDPVTTITRTEGYQTCYSSWPAAALSHARLWSPLCSGKHQSHPGGSQTSFDPSSRSQKIGWISSCRRKHRLISFCLNTLCRSIQYLSRWWWECCLSCVAWDVQIEKYGCGFVNLTST